MYLRTMIRAGRTVLPLVCLLFASQLCIAEITGKWVGHFQIDFSKEKHAPEPKIQQAINKQMKKQAYFLTLKPNRTFIATSTGPSGGMQRTGTWTLKGATLALKLQGKSGRRELAFASTFMADDARQILSSNNNGFGQTLTFTRK